MSVASVRYIVEDVDAAIAFYTEQLGFAVIMHPAPAFAMLARGDLRLLLSSPSGQGGGGQILADGRSPEPGGWNRFQIEVEDLRGDMEGIQTAGGTVSRDFLAGIGC